MIYADLLFLINLFADFIIFSAASIFAGYKESSAKLFLSAAFSAFAYCIAIVFLAGNIIFINISMAISLYMCFRPKSVLSFIELIFYTYVAAMLTGGIFSALYFMLSGKEKLKFSFPVMALSSLLIYLSAKFIAYRKSKKQTICCIKITKGKRSISARGLIDTGNTLCEPYTGKPVTIISERCVRDIMQNCSFIYVPFKSVGQKNGILRAFTADKMEIEKNVIENAIIGIADFSLDPNFDAVLNPQIISQAKQERKDIYELNTNNH